MDRKYCTHPSRVALLPLLATDFALECILVTILVGARKSADAITSIHTHTYVHMLQTTYLSVHVYKHTIVHTYVCMCVHVVHMLKVCIGVETISARHVRIMYVRMYVFLNGTNLLYTPSVPDLLYSAFLDIVDTWVRQYL